MSKKKVYFVKNRFSIFFFGPKNRFFRYNRQIKYGWRYPDKLNESPMVTLCLGYTLIYHKNTKGMDACMC